MVLLGALVLGIGGIGAVAGGGADTARTVAPQSVVAASVVADTAPPGLVVAAVDSPPPRRRPKAVEISDWYSRRLAIHRYMAYSTIPLFALQYAAGDQLWKKGASAPTWAKTMHRVGATALVGTFTINTVTGLWNWWDSRTVRQGWALRTVHAFSMITCDAAFSYTGSTLQKQAETSAAKRRLHRTVALSAMGLTVASATAMGLWNR